MSDNVTLRDMVDSDLPVIFQQENDPDALQMAAFTPKDPSDYAAFLEHWARVRADAQVIIRTILVEERIAGHVLCHRRFGDPEVSFWLGREYWGRGVATRALELFLRTVSTRPLQARTAHDNAASLRVLEKCGFVRVGTDRGFANARGGEIDEILLRLA